MKNIKSFYIKDIENKWEFTFFDDTDSLKIEMKNKNITLILKNFFDSEWEKLKNLFEDKEITNLLLENKLQLKVNFSNFKLILNETTIFKSKNLTTSFCQF